jgi:alcohol dehydrogenase class IV
MMTEKTEINEFIETNNSKKVLLVTGKKSFFSSGCKSVIDKIDSNIDFIRFFEFDENPNISDLKKGIQLFNDKQCDSLIAIGGGSVMDMGKLISLLPFRPLQDISSIDNYAKSNKRTVPLMCIPTTAGSGSEATHFSVLYSGGVKYSISNPTLIPDICILNPKYSYTTSSHQRAISGLDALSQGIESFWAKNSTEESRQYSKEAVSLIWNNLYDSVESNSFDAHKNVFKGAHLAGKAINISKTTAPHALSYYFTEKHNIKHGQAVALTLPRVYYLNRLQALKSNDKKIQNIFVQLDKILEIKNNPSYVIEKFIKKLNIEIDFLKLGIDLKNELEIIKLMVNFDRFENNPFQISIDDIFKQDL